MPPIFFRSSTETTSSCKCFPKQRLFARLFQSCHFHPPRTRARAHAQMHGTRALSPRFPRAPRSPGPPQHTDPQGRAGERGLCIAPRRRDRHALGLPMARKRGFKRKLPPFHSFFSPKPWRTIKPSPFFLYRAQQLPLNVLFETSWLQTLFISCPKAI